MSRSCEHCDFVPSCVKSAQLHPITCKIRAERCGIHPIMEEVLSCGDMCPYCNKKLPAQNGNKYYHLLSACGVKYSKPTRTSRESNRVDSPSSSHSLEVSQVSNDDLLDALEQNKKLENELYHQIVRANKASEKLTSSRRRLKQLTKLLPSFSHVTIEMIPEDGRSQASDLIRTGVLNLNWFRTVADVECYIDGLPSVENSSSPSSPESPQDQGYTLDPYSEDVSVIKCLELKDLYDEACRKIREWTPDAGSIYELVATVDMARIDYTLLFDDLKLEYENSQLRRLENRARYEEDEDPDDDSP